MAINSDQEDAKLGRTSRRQWLRAIAGVLGVGVAGAALTRYMRSDMPRHSRSVNLGRLSALLPSGGQRSVIAEDTSILVVRPAEDAPYAMLLECTHAGCPLTLKDKKILCGCHGGVFDLSGRPESGPPKKPLARIPLWVNGDDVFVRLPGKRHA